LKTHHTRSSIEGLHQPDRNPEITDLTATALNPPLPVESNIHIDPEWICGLYEHMAKFLSSEQQQSSVNFRLLTDATFE
jgi:hypothetical protein